MAAVEHTIARMDTHCLANRFVIISLSERPGEMAISDSAETVRGATPVESQSAHDAALEANLREWIVAVIGRDAAPVRGDCCVA